ncbi:MAG TPA: hypothetical protein VNJ01_05415 [Bacteriovoracaceae bacterium]|nr:hypothetical protein [Bacteriovoracaceae bacterium]
MKTILVRLIGDPAENLYLLGLKEKAAFLKLEDRVSRLLSTNSFLRYGQEILGKARGLFKKKDESFFDACVRSYAEGLGIEASRYMNFLALFEMAAHYGQIYPELKALLPGCTSVLTSSKSGITHTRLLDFPLIGIFEEAPRLYYWQTSAGHTLLNYSCEGLAPLFLQGIHGSGFSFALHHKPGAAYHKEGQSIFQIAFEALFDCRDLLGFKKEIRKKISVTKWSFILLDKSGSVAVMDIAGPAVNVESYSVHDTSPLIFTNIPLKNDASGFEHFLRFSQDRQAWLKDKISPLITGHPLDLMTDVEDQKARKWRHPTATLSTTGAFHVNLTEGTLDIKEGSAALVSSDPIFQFSLSGGADSKLLKKATPPGPFEAAWKRASLAQSAFDDGRFDQAYHQLQMSIAQIPSLLWKDILSFYLYTWDFKFVSGNRELCLVYKKLKKLQLPALLMDQRNLLVMRFEKKLDLSATVTVDDVSAPYKELFARERAASKTVFAAWMKLIYPRIELLDVFAPHQR